MKKEFGRYQLLEKLGAGGVAEVYVAQVAQAGDSAAKQFSLKKLHREHLNKPDVISAFLAEAELTLKIVHPNVVRVLDFGQVGDEYYMAAEYVNGLDLAKLRDTTAFEPGATLQIAQDICAALDHVHDRLQVVHGDLSPSNVLVGTDGMARVTDFGVAVEFGATEQPVRGTYAYMSPEQARGLPLDARSDVFAVGVIVWELIQRQRLFRRGQQFLTITAVVEDDAPALDDATLDRVVQKALMKTRDARYSSCGEFVAALMSAWHQLGVTSDRAAVSKLVADRM